MDKETEVKMQKLKKDLPEYFLQPDQREGEVCINVIEEEKIQEIVEAYHDRGCTSARRGKEKADAKFKGKTCYPIFMSAEDYFNILAVS